MNQLDTLQNAIKNEARLRLLMPTYGIVVIRGNEIISDLKDQLDFFHIRVAPETEPTEDENVGKFGGYMNSCLVGETIAKAPSGVEAAKRLIAMVNPGISGAKALEKVYAIKGVHAAIESVLTEALM